MRLTERDKIIIEAVHRYRVLRQDQIQRLYFGTSAAAQRVMVRLYDHCFLERKFLPVVEGEGRSPTLYVLDKRGAELLRAECGYEDLAWYASSKDLKTDFMGHTTAINDFRITAEVAAARNDLELIAWLSEGQLKADYDRVTLPGARRLVSLIPDSYFCLATPLGRAHFFVEVDRGTETLDRFKDKVRAYVSYHAGGGYEKRYGTNSLRVLTIATGERRLVNLETATRDVTQSTGGRRRFWFALASDIVPATVFDGQVWRVTGEEGLFALIASDE